LFDTFVSTNALKPEIDETLNALLPIRAPEIVMAVPVPTVSEVVPETLIDALVNVSGPLFVASPSVIVPLNTMLFAKDLAVVLSLDSLPPVIVTVPEPRAEALPTRRVPAEIVMPPEKPFAAVSVNTPAPLDVQAVVPPIGAEIVRPPAPIAAINGDAPARIKAPVVVRVIV
jgi:hypothetical protein